MNLPRLSLDALLNRLSLEGATLAVIVEGYEDKGVLKFWLSSNLDRISIYAVDEIEVSENRFVEYGGNKGRVISIIFNKDVGRFAGSSIIGLIDRDDDFFIGKPISLLGIYYTQYWCLAAEVFDKAAISTVLQRALSVELSDRQLSILTDFMFGYGALRALKRKEAPEYKLPNFDKHVASNASFNWATYLKSVSMATKGKITQKLLELQRESLSTHNEVRMFAHDHSFYEVVYTFLKKSGLIDRSVSREEIARHFISYLKTSDSAAMIRATIMEKSSLL